MPIQNHFSAFCLPFLLSQNPSSPCHRNLAMTGFRKMNFHGYMLKNPRQDLSGIFILKYLILLKYLNKDTIQPRINKILVE
jgi:hypothetical protein